MSSVLVTGGSGFLGSHLLVQLLSQGHTVRASLRGLDRVEEVRSMVRAGGADPGERLAFVSADLGRQEGWAQAVEGCDYVLHVASPFPVGVPAHEDDVIVPAREGTLRVLAAARDAGVRRVVLTSSFAAVGYGHGPRPEPFDENDWTALDRPDVQPYIKSKTVAERAAWNFMDREGGALELSVVNPVGIFGPVLGPDLASSVVLVQRLLSGAMPFCPRISFGVVDVRDVAELQVKAMTHPAARGERFLATSGPSLALIEVARVLRKRLGKDANAVPRFQMPDWGMRWLARFDPEARGVLPQLGKVRNATASKARRLLGWEARSPEDTLVATGESLVRLGLGRGRKG